MLITPLLNRRKACIVKGLPALRSQDPHIGSVGTDSQVIDVAGVVTGRHVAQRTWAGCGRARSSRRAAPLPGSSMSTFS